jgi:hypothetical protein
MQCSNTGQRLNVAIPQGKPKRRRPANASKVSGGHARWLSEAETEAVLMEYKEGNELVTQIAERHSVSPGTVSHAARRSGIRLRGRGRRKLVQPTAHHKQVLHLAWVTTYEVVGAKFGTSKQNVGRIVGRWRHWCGQMWGPRKKTQSQGQDLLQGLSRAGGAKPHVVSFRITDAEFAALRECCAGFGNQAESPWKLARQVLREWLNHPAGFFSYKGCFAETNAATSVRDCQRAVFACASGMKAASDK